MYRAARSTLFDLAAGIFIVLVVLAGTPSAHATAATASGIYHYDAPTVTPVEVHGFGVAEARPMQASDVREWSASPPIRAQGTSTTSFRSFIATEAESELGLVCHSFDPRTEVVMADGSRKRIVDVQVGDRVRTTDPATGKAVVRTVTALHRNDDTDLADLVVRDGNGNESILHTTQHHRFWDDTRHGWVEAAELGSGDRLRTDDGGVAIVASVRTFEGQQWMYDLTVDDVHNYYVVAGEEPILVHNCGGLDALSESGSALDPADAGGQLTRAGRAFAKAREVFGATSGGPGSINSAGQNALDEILTNPGTVVEPAGLLHQVRMVVGAC